MSTETFALVLQRHGRVLRTPANGIVLVIRRSAPRVLALPRNIPAVQARLPLGELVGFLMLDIVAWSPVDSTLVLLPSLQG